MSNNKNNTRVAIVTQYPENIKRPHGGVEAVSVNLVKALSAYEDFDIHVITLSRNISEKKTSIEQKVTIHRLPKAKGSELISAVWMNRDRVRVCLDEIKPDIIHSHDTYGIMVKNYPCPKVFTVHGFIYGDTLLSNKKFAWMRSKIWEYVEKSNWACQPNIISISPYVRERLSGISTGMIYDIDNPISEDFFSIKRKEDAGVIFSSAVISPRKNTLNLIKAVKLLLDDGLDVQLRLAGRVVNEEYASQIYDWIKQNSLEKHVQFLGELSSEDIKVELSRASVYALVSLEENSPMGIEEAMAVGIPVVTSNRCGMPYMVRHFESGFLVDPFDVHKIAQKLTRVIRDEPLRRKLGVSGVEYAAGHYHPAVVAARTREVYLEILEKE